MKMPRWLQSCVLVIAVLSVVEDLSGAERKRRAPPFQPFDVEATVVTFRRYEFGTYVEAVRDNGTQEWIEIDKDEEVEVKKGQRVAYTITSRPHPDSRLYWYRKSYNFRRVLPDEKIYRGSGENGTLVFTDNPSLIPNAKASRKE